MKQSVSDLPTDFFFLLLLLSDHYDELLQSWFISLIGQVLSVGGKKRESARGVCTVCMCIGLSVVSAESDKRCDGLLLGNYGF